MCSFNDGDERWLFLKKTIKSVDVVVVALHSLVLRNARDGGSWHGGPLAELVTRHTHMTELIPHLAAMGRSGVMCTFFHYIQHVYL